MQGKEQPMKKEQTRYIVKRNYNASRTGADAFIKLIKKDKSKYENIDIEYTQYNIENDNKVCYTKDSFREDCVIPTNPKEE